MARWILKIGSVFAVAAQLVACGGGHFERSLADLPPDVPVASIPVGTTDNAMADPSMPRPPGTPCTVTLFSGLTFSGFKSQSYAYTAPANCPGPYAKIVLEADFAVTAGVQFDRTTHISLGGVNLYTGTTQQPSAKRAPTWHVERDVTEYAKLFAQAQTGYVDLDTIVDTYYNGLPSMSARLVFYPVTASTTAGSAADRLYALTGGDDGRPVILMNGQSRLSKTITFPTNVVRAYLDVTAQGQADDEFWYLCAPDNLAAELFTCGNTALRETQVWIDGTPAGVAPIFPWIFTGGIDPWLWHSIAGVQALNIQPFRVDLSPFAAVLSDGQPHTISVGVQNSNNYFSVLGTLFVYTDPKVDRVTGGVQSNTLGTAMSPSVSSQIKTDSAGNPIGTVSTRSVRRFQIKGQVASSVGVETITVTQAMTFSNDQSFDVNRQVFAQFTHVSQSTAVEAPSLTTHLNREHEFPLQLSFIVDSTGNYSISSRQSLAIKTQLQDSRGGYFANMLENAVTARSDRPPEPATPQFSTSQRYVYGDTLGGCYDRRLQSQNLRIVSAVDSGTCAGTSHPGQLSWTVDPLGGSGYLGAIGWSTRP